MQGVNSRTGEVGVGGGCCNLWGYPCETSVEGGEGKSFILRNYLIIVSLTVGDCFVY